MIKRILITLFSLSVFALKAQFVPFDYITVSLDSTNFDTVAVGDSHSIDVTITNNAVVSLWISANTTLNYVELIPDYDEIQDENDICGYPTVADQAYSGFLVRETSESESGNSTAFELSGGSSVTIELIFQPELEFEYSLFDGEENACLSFFPGTTECERFGTIPVCQDYTASGLGEYNRILSVNYMQFAEGDEFVLNPGTSQTIQGSVNTDISGVAVEDEVTGLFTNQGVESFGFHPNPATDYIQIEEGDVQIYDQLGVLVLEAYSDGQVDVSSLSSGVYVISKNGATSRLIIE